MSATPIPSSERFFAPEVSKWYFLPAVAASDLTPTRAELTAGDDLSGEIADINGWMVQSNLIDTPDLGTRFTGQIGGRITAPQSSLTLYTDKAGDDVRAILPRGTRGFMFIADGGDVAGQPADVFPCEVTSLGKVRTTGDQAHQITVTFAITSEPAEDVTIPAMV